MNELKHFLEYKLIEIQDYVLTPYHLLIAIGIIAFVRILLWLIRKVLKKQTKRGKIDVGQEYALYQLIKYFLFVVAISIILESIGIKLTILIAGGAALLVGIGFGIQQIFSDFISGILILFEGSIKVGDVIEVEGLVAEVRRISLRTTEIETRDDIIMIVPNSKFISEKVINWSHNRRITRFILTVGVAYGSDVDKVKNILLECAKQHKDIAQTPAPFVRFRDFGNSSLDFELLYWSHHMFRIESVMSDLRFAIDREFRKQGVTIPFPQRDLHIRSSEVPFK